MKFPDILREIPDKSCDLSDYNMKTSDFMRDLPNHFGKLSDFMRILPAGMGKHPS